MPFVQNLTEEQVKHIDMTLTNRTHILVLLAHDQEYGYFHLGGVYSSIEALTDVIKRRRDDLGYHETHYIVGNGTVGRHGREGMFVYPVSAEGRIFDDMAEVTLVEIDALDKYP